MSAHVYRSENGGSSELMEPLHVKVAEALGARNVRYDIGASAVDEDERWFAEWPEGCSLPPECRSLDPNDDISSLYYDAIPRYDTDWSALGPVIERYSINLEANGDGTWGAHTYPGGTSIFDESGPTPLLAACSLILSLSAAGKLDK